jgi:hypothetical protein
MSRLDLLPSWYHGTLYLLFSFFVNRLLGLEIVCTKRRFYFNENIHDAFVEYIFFFNFFFSYMRRNSRLKRLFLLKRWHVSNFCKINRRHSTRNLLSSNSTKNSSYPRTHPLVCRRSSSFCTFPARRMCLSLFPRACQLKRSFKHTSSTSSRRGRSCARASRYYVPNIACGSAQYALLWCGLVGSGL